MFIIISGHGINILHICVVFYDCLFNEYFGYEPLETWKRDA